MGCMPSKPVKNSLHDVSNNISERIVVNNKMNIKEPDLNLSTSVKENKPNCNQKIIINQIEKKSDLWHLGPMMVKQKPMSILLVFSQEDTLSETFWSVSNRLGYKCDLVSSAETAVELYLAKCHDVVFIDRRLGSGPTEKSTFKNNINIYKTTNSSNKPSDFLESPPPSSSSVHGTNTQIDTAKSVTTHEKNLENFPSLQTKTESSESDKIMDLNQTQIGKANADDITLLVTSPSETKLAPMQNKRDKGFFDPDTLCRSLRATKCNAYTIIVAILQQSDDETNTNPYIAQDLLKAGFSKYVMANESETACVNELIMLENDAFILRCKLHATNALFAALDEVLDAIDIVTMDKEIQYVNKAFENLSEYTTDELIGCSNKLYMPHSNVDYLELARKVLLKGKVWEGTLVLETKNGQAIWHHCTSIPIINNKGDLLQIVNVRNPVMEDVNVMHNHTFSSPNIKNVEAHMYFPRRGSACSSLPAKGSDAPYPCALKQPSDMNIRRPSLARIKSMTIEAPITKIINILTAAQQSSPLNISQALERALDILHTSTELYSLNPSQLFSSTKYHYNEPANSVYHGGGDRTPTTVIQTTNVFNNFITKANDTPETAGDALAKTSDIKQSLSCTNASDYERMIQDEEEKITTDLVGTLAGLNLEPRLSRPNLMRKHSSQSPQDSIESPSLLEVPADIQQLIYKDNAWDFPIFHLERLSNKKPLYYLAMRIFQRFGVCDYLKCSPHTLHSWLQMIESHYRNGNWYHNSSHAADVLQATAFFLQNPLIKEVLEDHEVMGALIAATVHDLDHPGRNSAFLCNSRHELALLYNDKSVLENHHVAYAFKLTLQNDECNIFKNLNNDDFKTLRTVVIEMVLATEMAKHFEILSKFLTFLDKCQALIKARGKKYSVANNIINTAGYGSHGQRYKRFGTSGSSKSSSTFTSVTNSRRGSRDVVISAGSGKQQSPLIGKVKSEKDKNDKSKNVPVKPQNLESALLKVMRDNIAETDSVTSENKNIQPESSLKPIFTVTSKDSLASDVSEHTIRPSDETLTPKSLKELPSDDNTSSSQTQPQNATLAETSQQPDDDNEILDDLPTTSQHAGAHRNIWREVLIELLVGTDAMLSAGLDEPPPSTLISANKNFGDEKDASTNVAVTSKENGGPHRISQTDTIANIVINQTSSVTSANIKSTPRGSTSMNDDIDDSSSTNESSRNLHVTAEDAQKHRALILDMMIKCADVSNPCRPLDICKEWSKRIAEEYFEQTDEERRLNLPVVMPTFDRKVCSIPQSQISFIDYFVNGMFDAWDSFCGVPELMDNLRYNYRYWKIMAEDVKHKRLSNFQSASGANLTNIPVSVTNSNLGSVSSTMLNSIPKLDNT